MQRKHCVSVMTIQSLFGTKMIFSFISRPIDGNDTERAFDRNRLASSSLPRYCSTSRLPSTLPVVLLMQRSEGAIGSQRYFPSWSKCAATSSRLLRGWYSLCLFRRSVAHPLLSCDSFCQRIQYFPGVMENSTETDEHANWTQYFARAKLKKIKAEPLDHFCSCESASFAVILKSK